MSERVWPAHPYLDGFNLRLRAATQEDASLFDKWDRDPVVISATSDDPDADKAFGDAYWPDEIASQDATNVYLIAEIDGRAIGAMQIIDPHLEPTHYWGEIAPNQRAIDIWIGEPEARGRGFGTQMMHAAITGCFSDPAVTAIVIDPLASNARAHIFYQRLGFAPVERRMFGEDDTLVHKLTRADWLARNQGD